jgi:hypothetical protein
MMRLRRWIGGPRGAVQLISLLAAAVLAMLAGLAYSNANGSWQNGIRLEEARSSALQDQVRTVYGDEAPSTVRVILDEQIAAQLGRIDPDNRLAHTQQRASANAAAAMRAAYAKWQPRSLAGDRQYQMRSGGSDVIARLRVLYVDEAAQGPQPDPAAQVRAGDAAAVRGGMYGAGVVVLSLIPALLAVRRRGRHRAETTAAELIPQPSQEKGTRRQRAAVIALALWLLAAVVPMSQLALGAEEQRSQAASARLAAVLTTDIAASNARAQFAAQAAQTARELGVRAEGRRMDAAEAAADERAVADAEDRAATAVETIVATMARQPVAADRLDLRLVAALSSEPVDWPERLAAQQAKADRSNRWGDWSNGAVILGALLAMSVYLVDLIRERIAVVAVSPHAGRPA